MLTLDKAKMIVYDLDGTLYDDTHHFDYYADQLESRLPSEFQPSFRHDYQAAREDHHTLQIGRTYDVKNDLILVQIKGVVLEAYEWTGMPIPVEKMKELYGNGVQVDLENMLSVGDLWWVPACIAYHYGLSTADGQASFLATREFMMTDQFQMNSVRGLQEAIRHARKHSVLQVLMTNSPQIDSERILEKLGLHESFDHKIFQARKPLQTKKHLQTLSDAYHVPFEQIVSVGDNWVNEIWPAQELGCQTVYIDPHLVGENLDCDWRISCIRDWVPLLKTLG